MKTKRLLIDSIRKGKAKYFGHMIRQNGLLRLLLEEKINGKRGKGWPRTMWANTIKEWIGKELWQMCESCREQTRMEVHNNQTAGSRWHKMMMRKNDID